MRVRNTLLTICGLSSICAISTSALVYYFILKRRQNFVANHSIEQNASTFSAEQTCNNKNEKNSNQNAENCQIEPKTSKNTQLCEEIASQKSNSSISEKHDESPSRIVEENEIFPIFDSLAMTAKSVVEVNNQNSEFEQKNQTSYKGETEIERLATTMESWATIVEESESRLGNTDCSQIESCYSIQPPTKLTKATEKKQRNNRRPGSSAYSKPETPTAATSTQYNKPLKSPRHARGGHNHRNSHNHNTTHTPKPVSVKEDLLSVMTSQPAAAAAARAPNANQLGDSAVISVGVVSPAQSNTSETDSAVISCGDSVNSSYTYNGIPSPSESSSTDSGMRNSPASPEVFQPQQDEYLSWEVEIGLPIGGKIIGRAGKNVKELRDKTGCKVIIKDIENNRRRQLLIVRGTYEQIDKCHTLLQKKFKKDIEFAKGVYFTMEGVAGVLGYPMSPVPQMQMPPPPPPCPQHILPAANTYLHLPQGVWFDVVVCDVITAGHFFLQQPTHSSYFHLSRLHRCMSACYDPTVPGLPSPVAIGTICAAQLDDNTWVRAQVADVSPDESLLTVRCLDIGGYREMTTEQVKQIRIDFLNLPFQATEVFLSEITPTNGEEDFSADATQYLQDLLSTSGTPQAYVRGWNMTDMPLVDLSIRQDGKFVSLRSLLMKKNFGLALEMPPPAAAVSPTM